jgi:hypothetical protein
MPRSAVLLAAAALLALLVAGCGAITQADQQVNGALDRYNSAVDSVRNLDLKTATRAEIKATRAQLDSAFAELARQSKEAGRDTADLLRNGNTKLDKTLGDAAALPAESRGDAQATLRQATDSVSSAVNSVWRDFKSLLE